MKNKHSSLFLPLLFWFLCFFGAMFFVVRWAPILLDADQASELILASRLKGADLLCSEWHYSTSLRVFDVQIFFKIGMLLSPDNWMNAMIIGQGIMLLLNSLCILYAARPVLSARMSIIISAVMLCPFSFWQEFYGVCFGFYLPFMMLTSIGFGLIERLWMGCHHKGVHSAFLCLHAIICGLGGIRMGMNFYAPMAMALLCFTLMKLRHGKAVNLKAFVLSIISTVFYGIGYIINAGILARYFAFVRSEAQKLAVLDLNAVLKTLADFLSLFGYPIVAENATATANLLSPMGILGVCGIALVLFFVVFAIRLALRRDTLPEQLQFLLISGLFMFLMTAVALSLLQYNDNGSYYLPCLPIMIIIIAAGISAEQFRFKHSRQVVTALWLLCVMGASVFQCRMATLVPLRGNPSLTSVYDYISEQGLTHGAATFWNSNVLTARSNGKIEMWTVYDFENGTPVLLPPLQLCSHTQIPEDCFFLIRIDETDLENAEAKFGKTIIYRDDIYMILK
ncbi:MAG: hypothetical protein MJ099_03780 [Clostridia bacterium]|nr:hypothetical protein [Clostridia bacterium]